MSRARLRRVVRSTARRAVVGTLAALPVDALLDAPDETKPLRNVVVVTGPHRSGTTIMGRLLQHAPKTFLVWEPFNLDWGLAGVAHRYPYLRAADTDSPAAVALRRYVSSGAGQWLGHGTPLAPNHERAVSNRKNVRGLRPWGFTAVVKDPFLLLSLEWVNTALSDRPPLVTLRHPCAWVSSLKRRGMHPRTALESFRAQDAFGNPVVAGILEQRDWEQADLVPAAAATWACLVRMLDVQREAGAQATVIRMEDFATAPYSVLHDAYRGCGLDPPADLERIVQEYTGVQNLVVPDKTVLHELRRNSAALVDAWRLRLTDEEQRTVREITESVAAGWYDSW